MNCRIMNKKFNQRKKLSKQDRAKLFNTAELAIATNNLSKVTAGVANMTKEFAKAARNSMEVSTNECTKV